MGKLTRTKALQDSDQKPLCYDNSHDDQAKRKVYIYVYHDNILKVYKFIVKYSDDRPNFVGQNLYCYAYYKHIDINYSDMQKDVKHLLRHYGHEDIYNLL